MKARIAWGLLSIIDGGNAGWLESSQRSRLKARLEQRPSIAQVGDWVRDRNHVVWMHGHPSAMPRLLESESVLASGVSAPEHDLVDTGRVEVYLPQEELDRVKNRLMLREVQRREANIVVKIPRGVWPFAESVGSAVVALDLWEAGDERSRRSARQLYSQALERAVSHELIAA